MGAAWPAGVPHKIIRSTYERTPEDTVQRDEVEVGPPLRGLTAPTRAQIVKGEISMRLDQLQAFEAWRKDTLDYSALPIDFPLYDHPTPRVVEARLRTAATVKARSRTGRRLAVELRVDPPAPTPAALSALAALHKADAVAWPAGVPGEPRVSSYQQTRDFVPTRSDDRNSPGQTVKSRLEGATEQVTLPMTSQQLLDFENWFEVDAAMGVRDILFPLGAGTHVGCFASGYAIRGGGERANWVVSFQRYLEAKP